MKNVNHMTKAELLEHIKKRYEDQTENYDILKEVYQLHKKITDTQIIEYKSLGEDLKLFKSIVKDKNETISMMKNNYDFLRNESEAKTDRINILENTEKALMREIRELKSK